MLAVFLMTAGLMVVMAAFGIPPFFPDGTGPLDGFGRLANIVLFPFFLCPAAAMTTAYAVWRRGPVSRATTVALGSLAIVDLCVGLLVIWGLVNTTASGASQARLATIWVFGVLAVASASLLGFAIARKR